LSKLPLFSIDGRGNVDATLGMCSTHLDGFCSTAGPITSCSKVVTAPTHTHTHEHTRAHTHMSTRIHKPQHLSATIKHPPLRCIRQVTVHFKSVSQCIDHSLIPHCMHMPTHPTATVVVTTHSKGMFQNEHTQASRDKEEENETSARTPTNVTEKGNDNNNRRRQRRRRRRR